MGSTAAAPAAAPAEASPPPLEEESDDDDFIPAGVMQLQSMLNEQERERGEGLQRKSGIQVASETEAELRKSVAKATADGVPAETNVDELD